MSSPLTPGRAADAQQFVDAAIAWAATNGLHSLTMRDLAQAVGKSTTVIVNLFGTKSALIQAVGEAALEQDTAFHDRFFGSVAGLAVERNTLLTLARHYVRARASETAGFARIWEALLLDGDTSEERRELMRRWNTMREDAWRGCRRHSGAGSGLWRQPHDLRRSLRQ